MKTENPKQPTKLTPEQDNGLDILFEYAYAHFCQHDFKTAYDLIQTVASFRPGNPEVDKILAVSMALSGRAEEGLKLLRAKIKSAPNDPKHRVHLASTLAMLDRHREAVISFKEAVALDGQNAAVMGLLGAAMLILDEPLIEIEALLRKAVKVDPKHVGCWVNLGCALRAQKKFHEASKCIQRAISLEPCSDMVQMLRQQELEDIRSAACRN